VLQHVGVKNGGLLLLAAAVIYIWFQHNRSKLLEEKVALVYLVPHDATDFVPVRLDYVAQITANAQTPAAGYVAALMNHPLLVGAVQAGLAVFWWDPLAALAATNNQLMDYQWKRVAVIEDGISSGRTLESPAGTWMRVGVSADTTLFESTLLNVLNGTTASPASNKLIVVSATIQAAVR